MYKLAWSERAHFFQVRGMQAEQRRLGLVLSLLLPPSLIPAQWRGAVKDPDSAMAFGTDVDAGADDPLKDPEGGGDMFVVGEERFAESYPAASILFAESEGAARIVFLGFLPSLSPFFNKCA